MVSSFTQRYEPMVVAGQHGLHQYSEIQSIGSRGTTWSATILRDKNPLCNRGSTRSPAVLRDTEGHQILTRVYALVLGDQVYSEKGESQIGRRFSNQSNFLGGAKIKVFHFVCVPTS